MYELLSLLNALFYCGRRSNLNLLIYVYLDYGQKLRELNARKLVYSN